MLKCTVYLKTFIIIDMQIKKLALLASVLLINTNIANATNNRVYIGGYGALNIIADGKLKNTSSVFNVQYDKGYSFGAILGVQFSRHFALEAEYSYTKNNVQAVESKKYDGDNISSHMVFANALLKVPIKHGDRVITSYLGAGIGMANTVKIKEITLPDTYVINDTLSNKLTYQFIMGAEMPIVNRLNAFVRYAVVKPFDNFQVGPNWLQNSNYQLDYSAHKVMVGLSWDLSGNNFEQAPQKLITEPVLPKVTKPKDLQTKKTCKRELIKNNIDKTKMVFFALNQYSLDSEDKLILDKTFNDITKTDQQRGKNLSKIKISGHTDSTGSHSYNMKLSGQRAETVSQYLINKGIKRDRITTFAKGDSELLKLVKDRDDVRENRRVEIMYNVDYEKLIHNCESATEEKKQNQEKPRSKVQPIIKNEDISDRKNNDVIAKKPNYVGKKNITTKTDDQVVVPEKNYVVEITQDKNQKNPKQDVSNSIFDIDKFIN